MSMRRSAAVFSAGAATALAATIAIQSATALPRNYSPYRKLSLFAQVLTYIENNYVSLLDEQELIYGAIGGMVESLDPHSAFMPPDEYQQMKADTRGEFGGLGVEVELRDSALVVISPIEGTPAHRAGLRPGDRITAIDGQPTNQLRMDQAVRAMRGAVGTRVRLEIRRGSQQKRLTITIVRALIRVVSVTAKRLAGDIALIRIKNFQERTALQVRRALEGLQAKGELRGVVLDLRNNPGGLLEEAVQTADLFLESGLIVRTTGKRGKLLDRAMAQRRGTFPAIPIVCLVNVGSASAAEIVAGALQDQRRAVLLGTRTFGKGSVQTMIGLDDGSGLKLTVAYYSTPSGRSIQERGIDPDVIVKAKPQPADGSVPTALSQDVQLRRAVEYLRTGRHGRRS